MNDTMNNWSVQVAGMALIGAATTAVFWAAEGFDAAWPVALIMTALIRWFTSAGAARTCWR
jgi:hypothetical protein